MSQQQTQLAFALDRRDAALNQVWDNASFDWKVLARMVVRTFQGQTVTGEDIRLRCEELNIVPHHPNAWGGFIMRLTKDRYGRPPLRHTGKYVPMRGPKSNARVTPVYYVVED